MFYCDSCDERFFNSKFCKKCTTARSRRCKGCCICNRPTFFKSKLEFYIPTRTQKKLNKSSRFIAAEIEVARLKKDKKSVEDIVRKWSGNIVYDGSLASQAGFEINTAPAAGDLYIKQVSEICDKIVAAGGEVDSKCGLHVHLDARDYNYSDLKKLVRVYAAIEPALFQMVPSNRRNNDYSIKCGDKLAKLIVSANSDTHINLKKNIVSAVYDSPSSIFRAEKRGAGHGTGRYYALNLHSWFFRGTVECRLFDGTIDKDEIINWGMLWANILDFSLHSSEDELSQMSKERSYESLIYIIKDKDDRVDGIKEFIDTRYNQYRTKKAKVSDLFSAVFAV